MEPVTLETDRLVLRPFAPEDTDAVFRACQDQELQRYVPVPLPYTRESARSFVEELCPAGWADGSTLNLASFSKDTGILVSAVGLHPGEPRTEGVRELGFWTAPEQRGHGYTAEAATAVCRWAFAELGARRLEWLALVGNEGSRAVAARVGFSFGETLRSRLNHRGTLMDAWSGSLRPADLSTAAARRPGRGASAGR